MKRKLLVLEAICAGAVLLAGCVSTVDGRHEAGVPWVKDTITARYERSTQEVWEAAKDVLKSAGTLNGEDKMRSTLEGKVDTRTVWVKVEPVDQRLTKVSVQARTKSGGGDVALASEIDKEIAIRLVSGNLTPASKSTTKN